MPFVYRYINTRTMLCVYVGKVTTYTDWDDTTSADALVELSSLSRRHNQHKQEDWYKKIGDENLILQYGGASYEAMVYYNIGCPYFCGDKRAHCKDVYGWYGLIKKPTREMCSKCKMEWLEAEVDE